MDFKSLYSMYRWRVNKSRMRYALWIKERDGWLPLTWKEYAQATEELAWALHKNGIEHGSRVALIAHSSLNWVLADMAIVNLGATSVVAAPDISPEAAKQIFARTTPQLVFSDDTEICQAAADTKAVQLVVFIGNKEYTPNTAIHIQDFIASAGTPNHELLQELGNKVSLDDLFSIVFTYGAEGDLRGAQLSHYNIIHELIALQEVIGATEEDVTLLILPPAHIFGRLIHLLNVYSGLQLALSSTPETLIEDLRAVKPHFLGAVPRIYQRLASLIEQEIESGGWLRRKVNRIALDVGRSLAASKNKGQTLSYLDEVKLRVADKILLEQIRKRFFGGRLKFGVSSGAPLGRRLGEWFYGLGVLILEAYGMTETCGAITMNRKTDFRFGTVGKPLSQVEVRLATDGEILVRGPVVMRGYFDDYEKTRQVIDKNGWFHTGDIGEFDEAGFLRITDRKHDIIITATGQTIAPSAIETRFRNDQWICRAVVHGEGRPYLVALITLNWDNVKKWASQRGIDYATEEELAKHPEVERLVRERIDRVNRELAPYERIKRFAILPKQFSVRGGEITITDRLRRKLIEQKYASLLDSLYSEVANEQQKKVAN